MATSIGNLIATFHKTRLDAFRKLNAEMYSDDREAKNRIAALKDKFKCVNEETKEQKAQEYQAYLE